MRTSWRAVVIVGVVAMLGVGISVAAALAQESPSQAPSPHQKVTFTWGSTNDISSLNPMSGYLAQDFYFWTATYHLLFDWDENLGLDSSSGPGSGLVTSVEISDDALTYTYHIKDGIMWSDGTPLTAEDVAYTLNLYKENHAYLPQGYLTLIDGEVQALDPTTIQFHSTEPTSLYSGKIAYMYDYILPKHVFEKFDKPKQFDGVPNVGSGPFVIAEYKIGEYVRMVQNPYWTGPKPHVDEVIFRMFKNEDALAEALKAGEVDLAYFSSANIYTSLQGQPNITTMAGTIPSFQEIGMNTGSSFQPKNDYYTPHGDGHPALQDPVLRRAIRMAIDSQTLVDKVLLGFGVAGDTIVPPTSIPGAKWTPTGDDLIAWDIPGANALLDQAGYKDCDGDGVREMPNCGESLVFRYFVRTNEQSSVDAAPFVRRWLEQIGIQANVEAMTSTRLGDIINEGTYDLFSWGWIPDPDPDSILADFKCDERPPDGHTYGNNDSYYCNPEYDKLYEEQRTETDPEKRWEIVHQMQKTYYEDAAYSVMWYDPIMSAWRTDRYTGYVVQPQPEGDPLESWGGPSKVWWTLRPVGAGGGTTETRGISAGIWIGIAAALLVVIVAIVLVRRRRPSDEEA